MTSGFVVQHTDKPRRPRRNDISVLMPSGKDLELMEKLKGLLPDMKALLEFCSDEPPLRTRFRAHHVKGYVYRYLEVERSYGYYGEVVFRVREDSPLARKAEELVTLRNALRSICNALSTVVSKSEFVLRNLSKFATVPGNKTRNDR